MRWLIPVLLLVSITVGAAGSVFADQTDPKLDQLFAQLRTAPNKAAADPIERDIWAIWVHRGDQVIDSHMALGIKAMRTGALHLSLREFSTVVSLDPQFAEGWNKRATVHYMMGNLDQSVRDIERTLALEPRHFGAISGMGLIFDRTDNPAGALKAWQRVLEFTPYNENIRKHIGVLREELSGKPI